MRKSSLRCLCTLLGVFLALMEYSCSSSSHSTSQSVLKVPFSLAYNPPKSLNLEENSDLQLTASVATSLQVAVTGCASGYTLSSTSITSGSVKLYKGDKNCVVQLTNFTLGSQTYSSTGSNAVSFNNWLPGDVATFQGASSTDLIKVYAVQQVSSSGVTGSDAIVYKFTDVQSTTTSSISQANASNPVPLSATGQAAPNFTMVQARYLSTNSNGTANLSFTLQCGSTLTGSSVSTYACSNATLQSQLDYIFIPDIYSGGALKVSDLMSAFSTYTPSSVGSLITPAGGTDLNTNTLTNGGFYTSNSSPLTTVGAAYSNLSNVFAIRRKDASGNTLSFLYFYVTIASNAQNTTVSALGTTFAGGSGTSTDPYQINSPTSLSNLRNCTSCVNYFVQTQDINLANISWTPIVNFNGNFNGAGYSIYNLTATTTAASAGLFASLQSGSTVSGVNLVNVSITVSNLIGGDDLGGPGADAGALVGYSEGTIYNCSASGTITSSGGRPDLGGLVGYIGNGIINASFSSVNITATGITSNNRAPNIGGLVGFINAQENGTAATISNSYAMGALSVSGNTGGQVGGLVGYAEAFRGTSTITNSYAASSSISSSVSRTHGFIGQNGGAGSASITGCYYYANGVPSDSTSGVSGLNATQLSTQSSFSGWNFTTTWFMPTINNPPYPGGLKSPVLHWTCGSNGITCQ